MSGIGGNGLQAQIGEQDASNEYTPLTISSKRGTGSPKGSLLVIGNNYYQNSSGQAALLDTDVDGVAMFMSNRGDDNYVQFTYYDNSTQYYMMQIDENSRISLSNNDSGTGNTIFGYLAGAAIAGGGNSNLLMGYEAGNDLTTADGNVVLGYQAFNRATDDCDQNVVVGNYSMGGNITSNDVSDCVALGYNVMSGVLTSTASGTVGIGSGALAALTDGAGNVALGFESQKANTAGSYNTSLGHQSMLTHDGGLRNVAIGAFSMDDTDAGSVSKASDDCIFIGYNSGGGTWANQDCSNIVAIGSNTLAGALAGDTVDGTIAIGKEALTALTTGAYNTAIGHNSMDEHTTGRANTCLGWGTMSQSGGDTTAQDNTFIGASSGGGDWAGAGVDQNTAVGYSTMTGAMTGSNHNSAFGAHALEALTSGDKNLALGTYAANAVTDGHNNVVIGNDALKTSTSVGYAIAIGESAVANGNVTDAADGTIGIGKGALYALTTGAGNTAVGYECLDATDDGGLNTAVGYQSLSANCGNANTAIGYKAGANVTGTTNTIIGHQAGFDTVALTSGTNNVIIGDNARTSAADSTNQIVIGRDAQGQGDNSVTLGNSSVTAVLCAADGEAQLYASAIRFPASQVANGNANALDDYEEGDWTPVLADVSGNTATMAGTTAGAYVKIGRQVTLTARLTCSSLGSCSGNMKITGLPFTVGNHNKFYNSVSIGYGESLAIPDDTSISGYGGQNTTTIVLWNWDDAAGGTALQHSEITADGTFFITTTYFID
jgi:hypothetical protein